ncbi:MAG: ribbon-helix-helix protein, CopG family [Nitrospirae bacterium]|nr:ribbon-helix-helix protein, CopG family [Nitrospirota bacterium]MBI3604463.1 ribbon-helix-helix protein, CopG family [Nitrospirota bacterium]
MAIAVKKTISLPPELAEEIEKIATEEGKSLSAVIQDAIRIARQDRLKNEFNRLQDYWSSKAKEKGILTEKDLESFLKT